MFTERNKHSSIIFAGKSLYGLRHSDTVTDGDIVTLLIGLELVLVDNIQVLGPAAFRGRIYEFQPSRAREYKGMKINDEIEFDEAHIFCCYR